MPAELQVRWAGPALEDLRAAHTWLAERSPLAARLATDVRAGILRLRAHPQLGRPLSQVPVDGDVRSLLVGQLRLIYRLETTTLTVLRLWDPRRDPAQLWGERDED